MASDTSYPPAYSAGKSVGPAVDVPAPPGPPGPVVYPAAPGTYQPYYQAGQPVPVGGGYHPYPYPDPAADSRQNVVVVSEASPLISVQPVMSFTGQIILACLVFWFCGWIFGLIAFVLALVAQGTASTDPGAARKYARASVGVSVAGIIVGILIIIIVVVVVLVTPTTYSVCVNGDCSWFHRRDCTMSGAHCKIMVESLYYQGCCYYDGYKYKIDGHWYHHKDCSVYPSQCIHFAHPFYKDGCCYYDF